MKTRELLTSFFYLLTRGTPDSRGVGWGEVNGVIDESLKRGQRVADYTSDGGRLLAEGMTERLLGAEPERLPAGIPGLQVGGVTADHFRCQCCTQTFERGARADMQDYYEASKYGRGEVLCGPCATFVDSLDPPGDA